MIPKRKGENNMSKFQLQCELAAKEAKKAAIVEVSQFCHIMGLPDNIHNTFIGGDPYGVVDFQEGYMFFNMTDIHVVVSEYARWLKTYGSNEAIAREVKQWYYWATDWHNKHPKMEWIDATKSQPEAFKKVIMRTDANFIVNGFYDGRYTWSSCIDFKGKVTHWCPDITPDGTYCPNLRSWLLGCPVPGLREATEEYTNEQEQKKEAAFDILVRAKTGLNEAIDNLKNGEY